MKDDETKYSIEEVIELCKKCPIKVISRQKTVDFLNESGKDFDSLKDEVKNLRAENACADPELDYGTNRKGYVYQFKKLVFEKYWCYIKVKIKLNPNQIVVVISFHKEDYDYVYKQN